MTAFVLRQPMDVKGVELQEFHMVELMWLGHLQMASVFLFVPLKQQKIYLESP